MPKIKCIECGKEYYGWALKYKLCYCDCGNELKYKEVKKVNKIPYFDVKVVKVKKGEKGKLYCPVCNSELKREKPLGNWVNGENLDKIKFPVPCSYLDSTRKRCYAILNKYWSGGDIFEMIPITQDEANPHFYGMTLKELIEGLDIHILKGKIILYEAVEK